MAVVRLTEDYLIEHMRQTKPLSASWAMDLNNDGLTKPAKLGRPSRIYHVNGVGKTLKEWAEGSGLKKDVIVSRLHAGWSIEDAVSRPAKPAQGGRTRSAGWSETSGKAAGTSGGGSLVTVAKQAFFLDAAE